MNASDINKNIHSSTIASSKLDGLIPGHRALHNNFITSVKALRSDLVRSAYYLLQIRERQVYRALGFRKIADYAAAAAGLNTRQCRDFLILARNLPRFQEVEAALAAGRLSWGQARLICTRTDPEEQEHWLDAAKSLSTRELLEELEPPEGKKEKGGKNDPASNVRPQKPPKSGLPFISPPKKAPENSLDQPSLPKALPAKRIYHVTLKLTGDQYFRWQRLSEYAQRKGSLNEAVLAGLAGDERPGAGGAGVARIVILNCPTCGRAVSPTNRGEIEVSLPLLKAAYCDAVIEDADATRRRTIPPRIRRLAMQRARYCCEANGCKMASFLSIHHRVPVANGGKSELENLVVLCWRCHKKLHEEENSARIALKSAPE